ncbi:hypothetical protein FB451DRAFT_1198308 [Mycena latifolia]|nr:hypothetical protein FB451DRAFT_1198308 [Mycena latifolia]
MQHNAARESPIVCHNAPQPGAPQTIERRGAAPLAAEKERGDETGETGGSKIDTEGENSSRRPWRDNKMQGTAARASLASDAHWHHRAAHAKGKKSGKAKAVKESTHGKVPLARLRDLRDAEVAHEEEDLDGKREKGRGRGVGEEELEEREGAVERVEGGVGPGWRRAPALQDGYTQQSHSYDERFAPEHPAEEKTRGDARNTTTVDCSSTCAACIPLPHPLVNTPIVPSPRSARPRRRGTGAPGDMIHHNTGEYHGKVMYLGQSLA